MKNIKFRAWDKEEKEMLFDVQKAYDYGCREDNKVMEDNFDDVLNTDIYIVMQFTGLIDREGNEIYDGDILEVTSIVKNPQGEILKVEYGNDNMAAFMLVKTNEIPIGLVSKDVAENSLVIGNVYQNPEMFK